MSLSRRQFLLGATALLAGCARRPPALDLAPKEINLGWRWVPGQQRHYRLITERRHAAGRTRRTEDWSWFVREVSPRGAARLVGTLTALRVERDGVETPEHAQRSAERASRGEVHLTLGMDGQLSGFPALSPEASLPHLLLALPLASYPVTVGASWPDPALARWALGLLPPKPPAQVQSSIELEHFQTGEIAEAALRTLVEARPQEDIRLRLVGSARWDLRRGLLLERQFQGRLYGVDTGPEGTLSVQLKLL